AAKTDPRFAFSIYKTGDMFNNGADALTDGEQNGNSSTLNGATVKTSWRKYTLIYKQSVAQANFYPGGINQRVIRYAEVLLMLAECSAETGDLPGAVGYLNQIRDRADVAMPHYPTAQYPTGSKDQVMKAVMHEKTAEMACEEVRNIDIMRWRAKGYFTTDPLPYFHAGRDELLPIPQAEIDNNPKLGSGGINKQNPGY
ncbi:MAG TPA: RagB/SusD family nutrient uptake outer membrane protein, partial [Puia sp.]